MFMVYHHQPIIELKTVVYGRWTMKSAPDFFVEYLKMAQNFEWHPLIFQSLDSSTDIRLEDYTILTS